MLAAARPYELRILGPDSLGILVPGIGLNASFAHVPAARGKLAFLSQSGALCGAVLDWAQARGIGFSHFISLGKACDVDFGDVMDYLASDFETRAILLYIEDIRERRNFISAGRAAARSKPVLVVKANRFSGEEPYLSALLSGTSAALVKPDDVFDAALRRAGMLRVAGVDEMFAAVETLARARPIRGDRLMVLINGGGAGLMASEVLFEGGGRLASLSPSSVVELDSLLQDGWNRQNPVDIRMDATGDRYAAALKILVRDPAADAVLVTYTPNSLTPPEDPARAVIQVAKEMGGNILTTWAGEATVRGARKMLAEAGLPTYHTPGRAVRGFLHMVHYHQNQEMLMQTPPSAFDDFSPAVDVARAVIQAVVSEGRSILTELESKAVLSAYGLCMVEIRATPTIEQAAQAAEQIGFPVALTIASPALRARWDVGGVALNLQSAEAVSSAAAAMLERLRQQRPNASFVGFTVRPMVSRHNARQLIIGIASDPLFGPVILFGEGGRAVEIVRDHAIALPPLNADLARQLISRTRISRLLGPYLDRPAANIDGLCTVLTRVSQMVVDLPEIVDASLNPLFIDERDAIFADCFIRVAPYTGHKTDRLSIRPYPKALEEPAALPDGRTLILRPIRPEDEPALCALMDSLSPEDIRLRFFACTSKPQPNQMARFTQIDYEREMAFVATTPGAGGSEILGVVQSVADSDNQRAEFSVIVRPEARGTGLARSLLEKMIRYCRETGIAMLVGEVLPGNHAMLHLAEKMGFSCERYAHGESGEVRLNLQ